MRPCKKSFGKKKRRKRKFGSPSLGSIMSKNNVGYRKSIIKPGDTITVSSTGKVKKES